jgi:indolepyruvate decarboxylase
VLFAGLEIFREQAESPFLKLAEQLGAPVVTTMLAKGVFPMNHPQHMGIHMGPFSPTAVAKRVRDADLVLALGTQLTDMNLGASAAKVSRGRSVWAIEGRVNVSYHQYTNVTLPDFIKGLSKQKLPRFRETVSYSDNLTRGKRRKAAADGIAVNDLLLEVNDFLAAHRGYNVFAESGDMLFGGLEVRLNGGLYMAQGYYASMGFAIPAAMGAEIGTGVRPLVLCGDGSFQMTGPEISHAPGKGLAPIVVLVNNAGWSIFRPVSPRQDLLEVPPWPYAELATAWGGLGLRAETPGELRDALETAHGSKRFTLIDCRVPGDSLSPISRKYIEESARKGQKKA